MTRRHRQCQRVVAFSALLACVATTPLVTSTNAAVPRVHTAKRPGISLSAPSEAASEAIVVARGKVTRPPPRARVLLQFRQGGKWRALARGKVRRGSFRVSFALPPLITTTRIRAALLSGRRRVAISGARRFRVRGKATDKPPATAAGLDPLSAESLMATVREYASLPDHLSGTANSADALDTISRQLAGAGLRLGQQAFTFPRFLPTQIALTAGADSVPAVAIAPLLYSGTTSSAGVSAPLVFGGDGSSIPSAVGGKIVVVSIGYQNNSKALNLDTAIEAAVEHGAKGLVAVTQGVGDHPKWEDVNARKGTGSLPVLMVGKTSGAAVIEAAENGESANLVLTATTGTSCDRDVWGELEGADPSRRVFIATPASSFTPSASEHGTGVAIVLGLARHYAALPRSQRPETLVFMALGGHEIGWLGLQALMSSAHGSWFTGADAYVHLGSALGAPTAKEEPGGTISTTPVPDPSGRLHNSENPLLETSISADFSAAGVPTPNTPPHIASGGEQTYAYAAGVPTVSFSGASLYFHTAGDLPAVVEPTILAEDADAFRRSVDTITGLAPGQLRAANGLAATYGSELNPDTRAPTNPTLAGGGVGGPAATPVAQCP